MRWFRPRPYLEPPRIILTKVQNVVSPAVFDATEERQDFWLCDQSGALYRREPNGDFIKMKTYNLGDLIAAKEKP